MSDSSSSDQPLTTDSASQTSIMATSKASITTTAPATNDNFRTVFVTITTSAGPHYTMNATERMWDKKSTAVGQWSAVGVMGVYVLFALCLLMGWFIRCIRRKPKVRPSSFPPEVTQRGDGSFLATQVAASKKRRARSGASISAVSAMEARDTSRYSFEDPPGNDRNGGTMIHDGSLHPTHKSVRNLAFEDQSYLPPISVSPTISDFSTSQRGSASTYGNGNRRYASSQTNLIPLPSPPNQYRRYLGEALATEAAEQARLGGGSRNHNRTSSQSTLRYYFAHSEDDHYDPELELPVPPVPTMHVAAMVGGQNGNLHPAHT